MPWEQTVDFLMNILLSLFTHTMSGGGARIVYQNEVIDENILKVFSVTFYHQDHGISGRWEEGGRWNRQTIEMTLTMSKHFPSKIFLFYL